MGERDEKMRWKHEREKEAEEDGVRQERRSL